MPPKPAAKEKKKKKKKDEPEAPKGPMSAKAMLHEEHLQALKKAAADEAARKVATKVRHCQWAVTKDASVKQTVLDWDKHDAQGFLDNFLLPPQRRISEDKAAEIKKRIAYLTNSTNVELKLDIAEVMDPTAEAVIAEREKQAKRKKSTVAGKTKPGAPTKKGKDKKGAKKKPPSR
mmetsp:Transcript_6551/g.15546  ORF Transcript_6551/g.15546 Transcript_6551/m.15546 type:complete len:176 (+) Transcript_6551:212-739(+)